MTARKTSRMIQVAMLVAALLAANAFLGYSLAVESERAITDQIRSRMMDIACSAAALIDGNSLDTITGIDYDNPAYEQTLTTLAAFQDNIDVAYIYCLRKTGEGTYVFIVDPAENPADFGEEAVFTDALSRAGDGTPSVDLVAYEDRWGRFYTAYCPVSDSEGNITGIICVDFDAAWYESHAADINRIIAINSIASLLLALIALAVIARMSRVETQHAKNLERANRYDSLTDLPNMGYFLELAAGSCAEMTANGEEPAMLYMDLANMKAYNMKHGFAEGDKLLKAFADILSEQFGRERCARFGQDHFAVSTSADGLEARLDAIAESLARVNGGKSLPVHIGINLDSLERGIEVSAACDRAKTACDSIRDSAGSGYAFFNMDMMAEAERRQYIIENLDRAISEGLIEVNYQPIVRSSTGKVCDEESLARWADPERGLISPAEFIPVLEDAKLVHKLDLHILELTLAKMQRMEENGIEIVSTSLNLSRSDFEACDIVEEVRERVDVSGVPRGKVNVEITETAMGRDFDFMREQVERFHDLGFQVWMDDFGSEYSSLDYLQNLHFDLLKLDMRFMQQFDSGNDKSKVILTELVKMALALGIETVAEGVETKEQADFLRKIGCSKMQGFYFSKPSSEEEIIERYRNGKAIGFENPDESGYYSALGRVNLYDLSSVVRDEDDELEQKYFNTLPMAVLECSDDGFAILRCNRSYYRFIKNTIGDDRVGVMIPYAEIDPASDNPFVQAMRECRERSSRLTVDEAMPDGQNVHSLLRRIAVNPVTGTSGIAVAVLTITKD